MDKVSNPNDFNFTLSSQKKGNAGDNIIRSLMERLFNTLRCDYKIKTPKKIQSIPAMNYYLFGVIGQRIDEALKEARDNLIKELNHVEIFQIFLKEGLKYNLLEELFKDIESQLKEGNKVINNDSTIVVKKLSRKKVIIDVDSSSEKKEKKGTTHPLLSLHGKRDPAKQFAEEVKVKYIARDFAAEIIKALQNKQIEVPKRLENLREINYYLFGVAYERDLEKLHKALIQKVNKKDIFDLLLKEGSANPILKDQFDQIKSRWEKEGGKITEDSVIIIEVLNKKDVIIKTDALNNKSILPIEDEKQLLQKEDNKSSFDIKNQPPDYGFNGPSRDSVAPNMRSGDLDFDFGGLFALDIRSQPSDDGFNDPSKESVVPNMRPRDSDINFEGLSDLFQQQYLNDDSRDENPRSQLDAHISHPQQQQEETQNDQIPRNGHTEEAEKKELMERLEESKNLINELSYPDIRSQPSDDGFNDPSKESVVSNMRPRDSDINFEGQQYSNDDSRDENPRSQLDAHISHPQQQQQETQNDQIPPNGHTEDAEKKELIERLEESKNLINELSHLDISSQPSDIWFNDLSKELVLPKMRPIDLDTNFEGQQDLNDNFRDENSRSQLDANIPHPQQQQEEAQNDQISPHGDTEDAEKKEQMERLEESKNLINELSHLDIRSQASNNGFNDTSKESVVPNMKPGDLNINPEGQQDLNDDFRDENPRSQLVADIPHPQQQQQETRNDQISPQEAVFEESKNLIDESKKQLEIAKQEAAEKYSQLEHTLAAQKAELEKQIENMETKEKEANIAATIFKEESEEKIRKLNEEKKALEEQLAQAVKEREKDRTSIDQIRNTLNEREQVANKKSAIEEAKKKELMEKLEESKNKRDEYKKQIGNAKQEAAEKYSQLEHRLAAQEAEFKKQIEDMETKQKETNIVAMRFKEESEETIRKLNEEKKAVEELLEDETQRLLRKLKKISQLNEALNTENHNLKVNIIENSTKITKYIFYVQKLEQKLTAKDEEIRRLEGVVQANTSQRVLTYRPAYRSEGTCWGCGGGPGHTWSYSCRGYY